MFHKSSGEYSPNKETARYFSPEQEEETQDKGEDVPDNNTNVPSTPEKFAAPPEETQKLFIGEDTDESTEIRRPDDCCSKYGNAFRICLPWRPSRKNKAKLPGNKAGLINYFSVSWMSGLMWKAYKHGLKNEDLWELQDEDSAAATCIRLERLWEQERKEAREKKVDPVLWKAAWKAVRTRIFTAMFFSLFVNVLQFIGPSVFIKLILDYIDDSRVDHVYGTYILLGMFAIYVVRGASFNFMIVLSTHTATRMTGGLQSMIYRKVLKLKTGGEKLSSQITNILTNDMERLFESVISAVFLTASPVLFILTAIYSVYIIGPWSLLGLGCYLLLYPVMGLIANAQSRIRLMTVKKTDKRVALMNEILNSMGLIKMYAWEDSFSEKVSAIRNEELKKHRIGGLLQAVASTTVPSISILATICTFLGYTLTGYPLKSSDAFTIFSMFNAMQFTAGVLPYTIRSIAEARISMIRIQKLLFLPEHKKEVCGLVKSSMAIGIKNATFAWEVHSIDIKGRPVAPKESKKKKNKKTKEKSADASNGSLLIEDFEKETKDPCTPCENKPTITHTTPSSPNKMGGITPDSSNENVEISEILFGVNLSVEKGSLIGVCGSVGSGKSSLVSAICGDMNLRSGHLQVNGRLALVSQQAWIYNATLRENIIVGQSYDKEKFDKVVQVCSLRSDIHSLSNGDLTEIGERGVNLSGGQKQRVNLARAVYSDRDIYLLDDPLSAVDTKVANHLFNRCIRGALSDKTVILVSHGTHFLERCDEVIMMKDGKICERGTHQALVDRKGHYYDMFSFSSGSGKDPTPDELDFQRKRQETIRRGTVRKASLRKSVEELRSDGKLIKDETKEMGAISSRVYLEFIRVCGGWILCSLVLFVTILFTLARIFNVVWLQHWLDAGDGMVEERKENQTMYNITYSDEELKGSIIDHPQLWMFQTVYASSFIFLIVSGVFKGIGVTFGVLAGAAKLHQDMFRSILRAPMSFLDTTPIGRILNRFSRDIDEIDIRIPFFLEFVLQGMLSIIAQIILVCVIFPIFLIPLLVIAVLFILVDYVLNAGLRDLKRLDNNYKSPVIQHLGASVTGLSVIRTFDKEDIFVKRFNRCLDDHSAAMIVFRLSSRWFTYRMDLMATMVTTAITIICIFTKGHISTATAGLALASINGVCSFVPFFMRMKSEFISRITSVERIIEYAYKIESEAPRQIEATKPASSWPSAGAIEFKDVKLRYRPELPLVLHGIFGSIQPGEKIGIVGRTGAGKSSLISTLMRMVELDSGSITIDSVDISTIGLDDLRSVISVIPQDPILFQGTIRYNMDPFDQYRDEEVWLALERAHLKTTISKMPLKLLSEVEAAGENFSVGEKQLICLARALLRKNKILMLDEATASVDMETDHLIQITVKEAFDHCTVLTIAHRLNTVATYDRVLVLHSGVVREFDSPEVLMNTEGSTFKSMMAAMGVHSLDQVTNVSS